MAAAVTRPSAKIGSSTTKKSASPRARTSQAAYTKPDLREKLKVKIKSDEKGGRPGQWSARKAQLLVTEYKKEGGGYTEGRRTEGQKHLQDWTAEKWQTADGKPAARGKTMARYLPKKAWNKLSPAEQNATDGKKRRGSRTGKQFIANTEPAKKARKSAAKS